jgi:hypothetical protein
LPERLVILYKGQVRFIGGKGSDNLLSAVAVAFLFLSLSLLLSLSLTLLLLRLLLLVLLLYIYMAGDLNGCHQPRSLSEVCSTKRRKSSR